MSGPKEEIESYIKNELPANFTSDEIMDMYEKRTYRKTSPS